jgi:hypothetical protein
MKSLLCAVGMLALIAGSRPAAAQFVMYGPPIYGGVPYAAPYGVQPYPYAGYPYYPYPLPPAPSLGFGRGGIYGHGFIGRGDGVVGYTLPGYRDWYR